MSLIYRKKPYQTSFAHLIEDYMAEMVQFASRIERKHLFIPLICLKSIEWSIYRWYKTPIRRFYGVKGNELIFMITRRCNERCSKCGIWKTPESDRERISINVFLDCLTALHRNLYQVTLTGGEPLLFIDDVLKIAEESRKLDVPMYIVTNGTLISEYFLNQYSKFNHVLVISLDTTEKNKWQEFRGNDSYDLVMNNIFLSKNILGKNLRIQSVYAHETKDDIPKVKTLCDELGIQHVIQPYMDFGGVWHEAHIDPVSDEGIACAARKNICVYNNGDVVKCFDHHRIPMAREPIGNIEKENIISILCKKRATEISRFMKNCNFPCKRLSCNIPPSQFET